MSQCKHKNKILTCKECSAKCCARCIQLEAHACPMLLARVKAAREELAKALPKIQAPKVISF